MGREAKDNWTYQMGTEAYDYSRQAYPLPKRDEEPLKRPKVQPKPRREAYSIRIIMCGLFIAAASGMFVNTTAQMITKQNELQALNRELRNVQSQVNDMEAAIAATLNLDYIRNVAEEELNMAEPLPHQVRYIEMSKESHTLYNE